jgi:hypothetical protein
VTVVVVLVCAVDDAVAFDGGAVVRVLVDLGAAVDDRLGVVVETSTLIEPATASLPACAVLRAQVLNSEVRPPKPSRYLLTASKPSVVICVAQLAGRQRDELVGRVRNG